MLYEVKYRFPREIELEGSGCNQILMPIAYWTTEARDKYSADADAERFLRGSSLTTDDGVIHKCHIISLTQQEEPAALPQ